MKQKSKAQIIAELEEQLAACMKEKSEERFRSLFEHAPVAYQSLDEKGCFLDVNPAYCKLTGYSADELIGRSFGDLWVPETRSVFLQAFEVLKCDNAAQANLQLIHKDGTAIEVVLNGNVQRDEQGQFIRTHCILHDVTERKLMEQKLRESEHRYALLFQKSNFPVILMKLPEVVIADVNEAAEKLTGFSREEMIGKTSAELGIISHEQRAESITQFEQTGKLAENERRIVTKSGEERIISFNTNPLEINGQPFAFTSIQDITERKLAEKSLEWARNTLEQTQKIAHMGSFEYIAAIQTTIWSEEEYRIYGLDPAKPSPAYEEMLQKMIHPDDAGLLHDVFTKAMQSSSVYELEHRILQPDGSVRWVYDRAYPYFNEKGKLERYIGTTLDITERKLAEEHLRESEQTLQTIFDLLPVGVSLTTQQRRVVKTNAELEKILGLSHDQLVRGDYGERKYLRDDGTEMPFEELPSVRAALGKEAVYNVPVGIVKKNGDTIWTSVNAAPLPSGDILIVTNDITERKHADEKLHESEQNFAAILENSPVAIGISRASDGQIIQINSAFTSMSGFTREEILGRTTLELCLWDPADRQRFLEVLKANQHVRNLEVTAHRKSGEELQVLIFGEWIEIADQPCMMVQMVDITERKRVENELIASEKKLRSLLGSQSHFVVRTDLKGNYSYWNDQFEKEYGWLFPQGIRGAYSLISVMNYHHARTEEVVKKCIANPGQVFSVELDKPGLNGSVHTALWDFVCLTDEHSQPSEIQCMGIDITERKQSEEKLHLAEQRYRALIENAPDGVVVMSAQGQILYASPAANRLNGFNSEEGLGANGLENVHPEDLQMVQSKLAELASQPGAIIRTEYRAARKDGSLWWVDAVGANLLNEPSVQGIVINFRDITERKQAEERLRASEERYRQAISAANAVPYVMDYVTNQYTFVGEGIEKLTGIPAGEMSVERFMPLYVESVMQGDLKGMELIQAAELTRQGKTGGVWKCDHHIRAQDGQERWIADSAVQILNDQGMPVGSIGILQDITEHKSIETVLEERIKRATAEIQDLYDNAPTGYHSLDAQGNITMINQTELNWLGYAREELIGRPIANILTDSSRALMELEFPRLIKDGRAVDHEVQIICKNGSMRDVLVSGTVIYDPQGNFLQTRSSMLDITERKKAEAALRENLKRVNALHTISEGAISTTDLKSLLSLVAHTLVETLSADRVNIMYMDVPNRKIELTCKSGPGASNIAEISFDEAWEGLTGWALREQKIAFSPGKSPDDRESPTVQAHRKADNAGDIIVVPIIYQNHPLGTITVINRPEDKSFSVEDLSMAQAIANQSASFIERLRAEIGLRQANIALEDAMRVKDEFLASMSHELRTPLTGILGLSEALQMEIYGELNNRQKKTVNSILDSGQHLLALINDILDLSKIEAGKLDLQFQPCSLADICQASVQLTKGMANQKRQQVSYTPPSSLILLNADARRLKQVIVNLLSNAIKFTPEKNELGLEVEPDEANQQVRLVVWDKGIGIKPENLPKLFKPFTQIDSSLAREYSGTGLGLSLVQRLVELHNGSVTVESVFGEGSRFTVTLPWTSQTTREATPAPEKEQPPQFELVEDQAPKQLILIADDNQLLLDMLADFLEAQGYRTIKIHSGKELVVRTPDLRPDLVLMDIQMPGMDGMETIRYIRACKDTVIASIPIIAVTALAMTGDRERCLAAGANDYLSKPVNLRELASAIERLLPKGNA